MKVTKRILAIVMTMLMLLGTCAVAASAAGTLQAAINNASAGGTVTMSGDTTESVVINKDLTLDLGGYELKGEPGSVAITVIGANVTITNGHVVSQFANVKSLDMMATVVDESPAAINVKGGSVTVEGVRAVGSMTRIPTTSKYHFPTGSAVALTDGATATIKQSSLVGRYGVNNKVTNAVAGGEVTIEDAIMMGFMRAVKDSSKEIVADGTEKVNAADRIEGFLNSGIKLEERERRVMKLIFAERVMLYTKSVQDDATTEISTCTKKATVTAHEDVSNIWQNNTSTDCSYKYVPEYVVLADGKLVKMTADGDAYTAEIDADKADGIQVKYRMFFDLQPDIQGLTSNFNMYLEDLYQKVIKTAGEVYDYALERYNRYTKLVGDILYKLDVAGSSDINGRMICTIPQFIKLRQLIVDLGGRTAYNAGPREFEFDDDTMEAYYGAGATMPADGIVGTIDRVAKLKAELESFMPFSDTSKWADMALWAFDNYQEVIDIMDEADTRLAKLQTYLDDPEVKMIVEKAGQTDKRAALDKVQKITADAKAAVTKFMSSYTVNALIQKANNNRGELKDYVNKFIGIYNNHEVYFTPSKFLDGNFAKAYALYGDATATDVTEHQYDDNWTSDGDETHSRVCAVCGEAKETLPHDLDTRIVKNATCTEPQETLIFCEDCGYEKTVYGDYINGNKEPGHDFGDWEFFDAQQHEHFCEVCGESEKEDHQFDTSTTAPTCTADGTITYTCSVCGYSYTTDGDPMIEHTKGEPVKENEVAPACNADGSYEEVVYCTVCGTEIERKTVVVPTDVPHNYDDAEWVYADADKHVRTCNNCGFIDEDTHTPGETVIENQVDATCAKDGSYDEVVYCTVCEGELSRTTIIVPASSVAHTYADDDWVSENDTQHVHFCSVCGEPEYEDHDLQEARVEPTCTKTGSITYTCSKCDYQKVETIPANGHTPAEETVIENVIDPTCTENGSHEEVLYCTVCGEAISREKKIDPAIGHIYDKTETEPTCTEDGVITYVCQHDASHTYTEPGKPALGHDWTEWVETKPATEKEEGEETRTCNRCGETETRSIPKLPPQELTLTYPCYTGDPAKRISAKIFYGRRGTVALQLIPNKEVVEWTSSKPNLLEVDENGTVYYKRLCVFCRTATITAKDADGNEATCVITLKLHWWQVIIYLLFGWLWY